MSLKAVTKCPFLSRVPSAFLNNAGPSLNMYGQRCPIMGRLFHLAGAGKGGQAALQAQGSKTLSLGE